VLLGPPDSIVRGRIELNMPANTEAGEPVNENCIVGQGGN
jgi:hypothetical protein